MEITNSNIKSMSDDEVIKIIAKFIKAKRIEQNKTQNQLAKEAGINRSTLSEFEQGKRSNIITLVQLLRALNQLEILQHFAIEQKLSPIQLAKYQVKERQRAYKVKNNNKPKSDW